MSSPAGSINRLVPGLVERLDQKPSAGVSQGEKPEQSFTKLFSEMLESVNDLQFDAAEIQRAFMSGEPVELHEVMIKAQEAGIAMDLLLEIRNKLMDAYSELMRMPL
ncbi:MAG: flagellar hook-basal body complex protein FliE [Candidatus Zixiibacteriota bacterium]|nr:MAG: flagellar hook-basal body complex protein FliE [candidate division Zixibacteria bacterium]